MIERISERYHPFQIEGPTGEKIDQGKGEDRQASKMNGWNLCQLPDLQRK
jgi:hypothetical protein